LGRERLADVEPAGPHQHQIPGSGQSCCGRKRDGR
jgi:hypothetical protein